MRATSTTKLMLYSRMPEECTYPCRIHIEAMKTDERGLLVKKVHIPLTLFERVSVCDEGNGDRIMN